MSATESNGSMQVTTPVAVATQTVFGGTEMWQKEAGGTDAENEFSAVLAKQKTATFRVRGHEIDWKALSAAGLAKTGEAVALAGKSGTQMARDKRRAGDWLCHRSIDSCWCGGRLGSRTIEEIANVDFADMYACQKACIGDSELAQRP